MRPSARVAFMRTTEIRQQFGPDGTPDTEAGARRYFFFFLDLRLGGPFNPSCNNAIRRITSSWRTRI